MTQSMGECFAQAAALEQLNSAVLAWIAGNDNSLLHTELRSNPVASGLSTPNLVEFAANQRNYEAVAILMSFVEDITPFRSTACLKRLYHVAAKTDDVRILRQYPLEETCQENFDTILSGLYEVACTHGSLNALRDIHGLSPPDIRTWSEGLFLCLNDARSDILSFLMASAPASPCLVNSPLQPPPSVLILLKHLSELYFTLHLNQPDFFCEVFEYATCEQVCAHIPMSHHDRVQSLHQHYVSEQALRQRTKLNGALENSSAPPRGRKL